MKRHELFPAEELPPGEMRRVQVGGVATLVLRQPDGEFAAMFDRCPHSGAPLSDGWITKKVVDDPQTRYALSEDYVVRCPWHRMEFETATGACPADPKRMRVKSYRVVVEDGIVYVER